MKRLGKIEINHREQTKKKCVSCLTLWKLQYCPELSISLILFSGGEGKGGGEGVSEGRNSSQEKQEVSRLAGFVLVRVRELDLSSFSSSFLFCLVIFSARPNSSIMLTLFSSTFLLPFSCFLPVSPFSLDPWHPSRLKRQVRGFFSMLLPVSLPPGPFSVAKLLLFGDLAYLMSFRISGASSEQKVNIPSPFDLFLEISLYQQIIIN